MDISVLIPTRGRPQTLRRCLEHLAAQIDPPDFEVVVCIDGEDSYAEAGLDKASRTLEIPVTVVRSPGRYQAAATNRALEEAKGEYVVILGDDIFADPHLLRSHLARHRSLGDPRIAVQGKVAWHPELLPDPFLEWEEREGVQFAFRRMEENALVSLKYLYTCNVSMRRDWLETLGGFDASLPSWMDTVFAFEAGKQGLRLFYDPGAFAYHHDVWTLERIGKRRYQKGRTAARLLQDPDFARHVQVPRPGPWRSLRYRASRVVRPVADLAGWRGILGWCWIHEVHYQFTRGFSDARREMDAG